MAAPEPSTRLLRAVAAEREQLRRQRQRLAAEADELRRALARIEAGLAEIDERCTLLDRLAPAPDHEREPERPAAGALRGPAIREHAVEVLLRSGRDRIHYREWFELLTHEIAGKDPLAVFLTQISRSPVVRKGPRAGVYELDRQAPARLRAELERLQRQLRELTVAGADDIGALRSRRNALTAEIGRAERALEEATRLLGGRPALAAASA